MCTHVKEGSGNSSTLSPTPLWKMANVPSERPTSTRPFTCLWEEMCENYMFKQANRKEINSSCHLSECTYTMPSTESFSFIEWRHFFHWATEECTYTLESQQVHRFRQRVFFSVFKFSHLQKCWVKEKWKKSHYPFCAPSHIVGRTLLIFWASSLIRSCSSALGFKLTPSFSRSLSLLVREHSKYSVYIRRLHWDTLILCVWTRVSKKDWLCVFVVLQKSKKSVIVVMLDHQKDKVF